MRGYRCPECKKHTAIYQMGAYHCGNESCNAIWWTAFDKPSAGTKRKGYACVTCQRQTVHPLSKANGVEIWRCSTCATTTFKPIA